MPTYETNTVTPSITKNAGTAEGYVSNEAFIRTSQGWKSLQGPPGLTGLKGDPGPIPELAAVKFDQVHSVGGAGEPAFLNSWKNYDNDAAVPSALPGYRNATFRKDPFGKVRLSGTVKAGATGTVIFQLPVGYRPKYTRYYSGIAFGNDFSLVWVDISGNVSASSLGTSNVTTHVMLDEVEFDTETVTELTVPIVGASQAVLPIEDWKTVGADGGATTFVNNWASYGGAYPLQYRKRPDGTVEMRGLAKGNGVTATAAAMFTLPAGYTPALASGGAHFFEASTYGGSAYVDSTKIQVAYNGTVTSTFLCPAGGFIAFDSVRYPTSQTTFPTGPQGPKGDKGDAGGVQVLTTLNWNTAIVPGFYRSYVPVDFNDFNQTINGPGDALNPPEQAGIVAVHQNGDVVQRVWDLDQQRGWTRYYSSGGGWTAWIAELVKIPVLAEVQFGGPNPADGDERYIQSALMKAQGVRWRQCYDATSALTHKWEFAGGQAYRSKATASYTAIAANAWEIVAAATFPRFTIPFSGVYRVKFGSQFRQQVVGAVEGYMGIGLSTAATPIDNLRFNAGQNASSVDIVHMSYEYEAAFTEGQILVLFHNTQTAAGNILYAGQWMEITPVRTA